MQPNGDLLGPPDTVGLRLDGSIFIYRYRNTSAKQLEIKLSSTEFKYDSDDLRTARLVVFFDKKGVASRYSRQQESQVED